MIEMLRVGTNGILSQSPQQCYQISMDAQIQQGETASSWGGMDWGAPIVKQMDLLEWGCSGTGKEDTCIGTEPQWVSWGQVGRSESPELLSAMHAGIGGPLTNSLGDG